MYCPLHNDKRKIHFVKMNIKDQPTRAKQVHYLIKTISTQLNI